MDDPELVRGLVQRAAGELTLCLQPGGDMRRARLLLRFAAALVVTNVLHAASVVAALRALVDAAMALADSGEAGVLCARHLAVVLQALHVWCTALPLPAGKDLGIATGGQSESSPAVIPPSLPVHSPPPAAAAPAGDDGRSWQPYADHLVYTALMALPWGGPELAESVPDAVADLLAAAEAYLGKRPRSTQPSLRPFSAAVKKDENDSDLVAE